MRREKQLKGWTRVKKEALISGNKELLKKLYKDHFNVELSDQDALEKAIKLKRMVEIVYKPITQKKYEEYLKRRGATK